MWCLTPLSPLYHRYLDILHHSHDHSQHLPSSRNTVFTSALLEHGLAFHPYYAFSKRILRLAHLDWLLLSRSHVLASTHPQPQSLSYTSATRPAYHHPDAAISSLRADFLPWPPRLRHVIPPQTPHRDRPVWRAIRYRRCKIYRTRRGSCSCPPSLVYPPHRQLPASPSPPNPSTTHSSRISPASGVPN